MAWREQLVEIRRQRDAQAHAAEAAQGDLYAAIIEAADSGELTYDEIAEAVGLTRIRVGQVLRKYRAEQGRPTRQCAVVLKDGGQCRQLTAHETGLCWTHRELAKASA